MRDALTTRRRASPVRPDGSYRGIDHWPKRRRNPIRALSGDNQPSRIGTFVGVTHRTTPAPSSSRVTPPHRAHGRYGRSRATSTRPSRTDRRSESRPAGGSRARRTAPSGRGAASCARIERSRAHYPALRDISTGPAIGLFHERVSSRQRSCPSNRGDARTSDRLAAGFRVRVVRSRYQHHVRAGGPGGGD
jgi:hypothetical protein